MQDDLGTIADAALDQLEQADAQGDNKDDNTPPAPEGDENTPTGEEGDDNQDTNDNSPDENGEGEDHAQEGEASQEDDANKTGKDKESEEQDDPDEADGTKGKQAQELTDEELLAELEKRGKKPEAEKPEKPEAPRQIQRPSEVPEQVWGEMKPWQQYVYQQLPYLEARAKDGTVLRVKTDEQVPADFDWISEQAKNQFYSKDIPAQSIRAEKLGDSISNQARQQQQQQQAQEEANTIVKGINELTKQGIVPQIKAQPGTPEFDQDPGVQRANQILALRQQHLNKGEFITVETAGELFKAQNPKLYETPPKKPTADKERKQASRNIAGSAGRGTSTDARKGGQSKGKTFPIGTSAADIADFYADQLD